MGVVRSRPLRKEVGMNRAGPLLGTILVMALVAANLAAAGEDGLRDPDDSKRKLDIKRIAHEVTDNGRLKHTIVMHDAFKSSSLRRIGQAHQTGGRIHIDFDFDGSSDRHCSDYRLAIFNGRHGLRAVGSTWIPFGCSGNTYMLWVPNHVKARITRPTNRSIAIVSHMFDAKRYWWSASTNRIKEGDVDCTDTAPDRARCWKGFLLHRIDDPG